MNTKEITETLLAPFPADAIEWRVSRAMHTKAGPMATVLAYVTARAIMDRLDAVFGIDGWQDSYEFLSDGVKCTLTCQIGDKLVSKQDGAPQTHVEGFKGGISDALKRTAVKYGIGRYLYNLTETWVNIGPGKSDGDNYIYQKAKDNQPEIKGYWPTPKLPEWALPAQAVVTTKPAAPKSVPKPKAKAEDKPAAPALPSAAPSNETYEVQGDVGEFQGKKLAYIMSRNPGWYASSSLSELAGKLTDEDKQNIREYLQNFRSQQKSAA